MFKTPPIGSSRPDVVSMAKQEAQNLEVHQNFLRASNLSGGSASHGASINRKRDLTPHEESKIRASEVQMISAVSLYERHIKDKILAASKAS